MKKGLTGVLSSSSFDRAKKSKRPMKRSRPKTTKIRQSAKNEECLIELPAVCNYNSETVVWCHENSYAAGKGMGLKARDELGAYGCSACHAVYDGQIKRPEGMSKGYVEKRFYDAMLKSAEKLKRKGLV